MTTRNSFDAMYAAVQVEKGKKPQEAIQQFAVDYYDIDAYKAEILTAEPGLNSDTAYEKALFGLRRRPGAICLFFPDWITGWLLPGTAMQAEGRMVM